MLQVKAEFTALFLKLLGKGEGRREGKMEEKGEEEKKQEVQLNAYTYSKTNPNCFQYYTILSEC